MTLEVAVFASLPFSTAPDIRIFKIFNTRWVKIDNNKDQTTNDDPNIAENI